MIRKVNMFFLFLLAPVIGFYFAFYQNGLMNTIDTSAMVLSEDEITNKLRAFNYVLDTSSEIVTVSKEELNRIRLEALKQMEEIENQQDEIEAVAAFSENQITKSDEVLEQVLSNLLGDPIGETYGEKATIKVYSLVEAGYKGYMAKVRINDPSALQMVLANDQVENTSGETTSEAAKRVNATLAINAGGFYRENGKLLPLGVTVVDGDIKTFFTEHEYPFVGFNNKGHLTIIEELTEQQQIFDQGIVQGASFRPTLLENGQKVPIPEYLQNEKHPRTFVGNFSNGELLFVVVDGRSEGWSSGITLEEIQDKLLSFKVKDAYNLDGGGSSTFYYDGEILNRPSDGQERAVTTNLVIIP